MADKEETPAPQAPPSKIEPKPIVPPAPAPPEYLVLDYFQYEVDGVFTAADRGDLLATPPHGQIKALTEAKVIVRYDPSNLLHKGLVAIAKKRSKKGGK